MLNIVIRSISYPCTCITHLPIVCHTQNLQSFKYVCIYSTEYTLYINIGALLQLLNKLSFKLKKPKWLLKS